MKKLVTTRQLIFILLISLCTLKVLFLPSLLAKEIGRDSYLFLFIMLMLDFLVLLVFLFLFKRYPELSFYEIMQKFFGKIIAKIIMFLFCLFFLTKCWAVFQSNFIYLNENLHTTIKWYTFSIPLLIVIFYMSSFGVNAFVRLVEIMFPVVVLGFALSFFTGIFRADFTELLPICENGFFSYLPKMAKFSFWFGDYLIFIVFLGNVKPDKKFNLKVVISILVSIVFMTVYIMIVYGVFSYSTVCHTNCISDILQTLPSASDIGSFDWIIILIWDIALFMYLTLNVLGAFYSIRQVLPKFNQQILVTILLALILGANLLSHFDIIHTVENIKTYVSYFSGAMQYAFPLLFLFFSMFHKTEKGKNKQSSLLNQNQEDNKFDKRTNIIKLKKQSKLKKPINLIKLCEEKFVSSGTQKYKLNKGNKQRC